MALIDDSGGGIGVSFDNMGTAIDNYYTDGTAALDLSKLNGSVNQASTYYGTMENLSADGSYSIEYNLDGDVIGYNVEKWYPWNTNPDGSLIDSNIAGGTASQVNTANFHVTMSQTLGQGGTVNSIPVVQYEDGQQLVTNTKNFVTGKVQTGAAGSMTSGALGKTISSQLYDDDPSFWAGDSIKESTGETLWNKICAATSDGIAALKTFFGFDSNGNAQAYLSEDAFSALALYMAKNGFFATGEESATIDISQYPFINDIEQSWLPISVVPMSVFEYRSTATTNDTYYISLSDVATIMLYAPSASNAAYLMFSKTPFTGTKKRGQTGTANAMTVNHSTVNGKDIYYASSGGGASTASLLKGVLVDPWEHGASISNIGYVVLYGTVTGGDTKPGTGTQSGATTPTGTANWNTPADAKQALQTQYPDLWANRIEVPTIQPDGTVQTVTYIPTAFPIEVNPVSPTEVQQPVTPEVPTGDPDPSTQASPQVNPNTATDGMLQTIINILTQPDINTNPQGVTNPETNPDVNPESDPKNPTNDNPNTPNTGTGLAPVPILPSGGASALFTVYNPTQAQLNALGAWLWSANFIDQILKMFSDPMQAIIGLHKVFATPVVSGTRNIVVGYLDSGVSSNIVSGQYVTVDCGSVRCAEYFGNIFDYDPHTTINIFLPFVGIQKLNTADVMRGTVGVKYHVDLFSGACLAEVTITRDAAGGILYTYSGDCAVRYPLSSGSYMGIVSGVLSVVGGVAGTIATGGAAAPALLGAAAGLGRMHTEVNRSGSISGNAGAMGGKKPYLIISRPQTAMAEAYQKHQGIGANSRQTVKNMRGYFKMEDVILSGVHGASKEELEEIRALLITGVIK